AALLEDRQGRLWAESLDEALHLDGALDGADGGRPLEPPVLPVADPVHPRAVAALPPSDTRHSRSHPVVAGQDGPHFTGERYHRSRPSIKTRPDQHTYWGG